MRIKAIEPKSSFLSADKDINLIMTKMLNNDRLKRLLYYNTPDCIFKDNLTEEQSYGLVGKNIKSVPKLTVDKEVLNYVIISFDNFTPSGNPEFRDNTIMFDIICHFDQWQLKDMQLRPYKIAGEIDAMFNKTKLTGIGELQFMGATQIVLNEEFGGLCLCYQAVHGGEDKVIMGTQEQEEKFLDDFDQFVKNLSNE